MPHDLTPQELENIPASIEKYKSIIRSNPDLHRSECEQACRKLKKLVKLQQEQDFERQFINPKFPNNSASIWYPNDFKKTENT